MNIPGYMTTAEAALRLNVSPGRVRQLVANGTLIAERIHPQAVLVSEESVKTYDTVRKPRHRKKTAEEGAHRERPSASNAAIALR